MIGKRREPSPFVCLGRHCIYFFEKIKKITKSYITNIYFDKSNLKNVKNPTKRTMSFDNYTFKPNEKLECKIGFLIDKDLEDAMTIMPTTGTQLELQVFK